MWPWAEHLDGLLAAAGIDKKAVAKHLGVDPSAYSRFMRSRRPWKSYMAGTVECLGLPKDEVFPPRLFQIPTDGPVTDETTRSVGAEKKNRATLQTATGVLQGVRTADVQTPPTLGQIDEGLMASSSSRWGRSFIRRANEILDFCGADESKLKAAAEAADTWLKELRAPESLQPPHNNTNSG